MALLLLIQHTVQMEGFCYRYGTAQYSRSCCFSAAHHTKAAGNLKKEKRARESDRATWSWKETADVLLCAVRLSRGGFEMQPVTLKLTLLPFALCAQSAACTVLQRDKIHALFFHT